MEEQHNQRKQSQPKPYDDDICVKACANTACEIQMCLARQGHNQSKCEHYITAWKNCCTAVKANAEHQTSSEAKDGKA